MSDITMQTAVTNPTAVANVAPPRLNNGVKLDKCPELKGSENYESWSRRVTMILEAMGIDDFVLRGTPAHDDPAAVNMKAQATMLYLQACSDEILDALADIPGAHDRWEYLKRTYQQRTVSCLVSTSLRFMEVVTSGQTKDPQAYIALFEKTLAAYKLASEGGDDDDARK